MANFVVDEDERYMRFKSKVGAFAYALHDMQLYSLNGNLPSPGTPLLSRPRFDYIETKYAKATISVVTGCNLGCSYCTFGKLPPIMLQKMTPDTGRAIIDYLCAIFGSRCKRITISFTSNGEPSLNLETIEAIKAYARRNTTEANAPEFRFNFATNSIPLSIETLEQYLAEKDQDIFFSTDGPAELHNQLRASRDSKDSYTEVATKIAYYRHKYDKYQKGFSCSTVLTALDSDFKRILLHLDAMGFEYIVMRPIRGFKNTDIGLNRDTLRIFLQGYKGLLDSLEERALSGNIDLLHKICNRYDFFGRLLSALLLGEERVQGCPGCPSKYSDIAHYALVFDVDGQVYFPCRDFIGREEFRIGSVFTKIDLKRVREVMNRLRATERPSCRGCWARTMCGGGCYNAALAANGDISEPDDNLCILIRYLAYRALQLVHELGILQPNLLQALTQRAISVSPWAREVEEEE